FERALPEVSSEHWFSSLRPIARRVGDIRAMPPHEGTGLRLGLPIDEQPSVALDRLHGVTGEPLVSSIDYELRHSSPGRQGSLELLDPVEPVLQDCPPNAVFNEASPGVPVQVTLIRFHRANGARLVFPVRWPNVVSHARKRSLNVPHFSLRETRARLRRLRRLARGRLGRSGRELRLLPRLDAMKVEVDPRVAHRTVATPGLEV